MTPSVGRMVHYHMQREGEDGLRGPLPAVVTVVDPDGSTVSLIVFDFDASSGERLTPALHTPFSEEPKAGHWSWPPRV